MDRAQNYIRQDKKEELKSLEKSIGIPSQDKLVPTPLELYCDAHPDAIECKIYEV